MGRMDNNQSTPAHRADSLEKIVDETAAQNQLGGAEKADSPHPAASQPSSSKPLPHHQPDHSMLEEEPLGWDQAPTDIKDARQKRHPRTEGLGGTP